MLIKVVRAVGGDEEAALVATLNGEYVASEAEVGSYPRLYAIRSTAG